MHFQKELFQKANYLNPVIIDDYSRLSNHYY